jgi:4-hydroxy-tetrahydrodipicolinate synthase
MSFIPQGIITPIITPTTADGKINEPVFRLLIRHLIDNGVHGIFTFGTTGEFYAFNTQEYKHALQLVVGEVAGKVPVYAGTNSISTKDTIRMIGIAEEIGADAVSVLTPMFISQTQNELYRFYETIAKSTKMPIVLYNNRPKTNVHIAPETVAKLAEIENIVAIKDSTGDMTNTAEYIRLTRHRDDFHVLVGRDTLIFAGLCYGATGAVASCSNVAPEVAVEIYEKFKNGDMQGALKAQFKLAPLRIACNMGSFPEVIKEGLMMEGYDVGKCVDPINELPLEEKNKLKDVLRKLELV